MSSQGAGVLNPSPTADALLAWPTDQQGPPATQRALVAMIMRKDDAAEKAQAKGARRVREWCEELLPDDEKEEDDGGTAAPGKESTVIVNQLQCKEPGCPDVEVVITLLRARPRAKLMFKIFKAVAELSREEVELAMQTAMDEESGKAKPQAHDHDEEKHGHAEQEHGHAEHGHAEGGGVDCGCGHDHAEHGHAEHGHAEHDHAEK
jgi:hypothetical protein